MDLTRLFTLTLLGTFSSCNERPQLDPGSSSKAGLSVTHSAILISDVPLEMLDSIDFPFVRFYRTDVKNEAEVPIRIVWFDGYFQSEGTWHSSNVRNKVLRSADFIEWHPSDDMTEDGWLPPGGTASCLVNWTWSDTPDHFPVKWAYVAIDRSGNDYFAEAKVLGVRPVDMAKHRSSQSGEAPPAFSPATDAPGASISGDH